MFRFKFTISEGDYIEFNRFHMKNHPTAKRSNKIIYVFLGIVMLIMAAFVSYREEGFHVVGFVVVSAISAACVGSMLLFENPFNKVLIKFQIAMMKKSGKLPFNSDVEMIFDEDSLIEISDETETKSKYSNIERIFKNPNGYIYIYINSLQAQILPMSVFESSAQSDEFWEFVHSKTTLKN